MASALRIIACAGALATGLLLGGPGFVPAVADTGDSTDSGGIDSASVPDNPENAPDFGGGDAPAGGPSDGANHPTSTIGDGRNDVVDPNAPITGGEGPGAGDRMPAKYRPLLIPILRIPSAEEFAAPGWTPPSAYFSTIEVPVVSLQDIFNALIQPTPKPQPSPAFRTQEEAPVVDATPGGGDGSDGVPAAVAGPPVFEAPLVVAPRMPIARLPELAPLGASAVKGTSPMAGEQAVVGANTPLIRGSLPPSGTSVTAAEPFTPMNGRVTQVGYPRYLRNPTVGELSMVALPGVAGLMMLTFSGGVIGYRQANSARFIRGADAARFLP
ncbi:MAG: hypothetical protein QOD39_5081 [Mycobacterium sp.]|jgi:hypothetical protein|nr:hypothetical protein [Mycobacterium sp.]